MIELLDRRAYDPPIGEAKSNRQLYFTIPVNNIEGIKQTKEPIPVYGLSILLGSLALLIVSYFLFGWQTTTL